MSAIVSAEHSSPLSDISGNDTQALPNIKRFSHAALPAAMALSLTGAAMFSPQAHAGTGGPKQMLSLPALWPLLRLPVGST